MQDLKAKFTADDIKRREAQPFTTETCTRRISFFYLPAPQHVPPHFYIQTCSFLESRLPYFSESYGVQVHILNLQDLTLLADTNATESWIYRSCSALSARLVKHAKLSE
jgi:hypothetical protein